MKQKTLLGVVIILILVVGGGYIVWNKKSGSVQNRSNSLNENGMTAEETAELWAEYGKQEMAKAGYPPEQSPKVNYDLAVSRAEGEFYFDAHNGSYAGVCNSQKMLDLKNHMLSLGNLTVVCTDKVTAWAMLVTLNGNNSRYWCADSQGNTASWKEKSANLSIITSCSGN